MSGLKPCPFCGGQPEQPYPLDDEQYAVCCTKCNAQGGYYGGNDSTSPEEAIAAWNARASSPDPASAWPESTCAECGEKIPPGQLQACAKGGVCSWHVPAAYKQWATSRPDPAREALVGALKELLKFADTTSSLETEWEHAVDHAQKVIALAEQGHKGAAK